MRLERIVDAPQKLQNSAAELSVLNIYESGVKHLAFYSVIFFYHLIRVIDSKAVIAFKLLGINIKFQITAAILAFVQSNPP